jgi:Zn-dependent protease
LELELFGKNLSIETDETGLQSLYWADKIVSKIDLSGITVSEIVHRFSLQQLELGQGQGQGQGQESEQNIDISLNLQIKDQTVAYQLWVDQRQQASGEFQSDEFADLVKPEAKRSFVGLLALTFKLFKSVKVIKVVLAGTSVAGYAWLFSIEFALVIVACLVVHEYGHVKAMQYFGIKTKGIYLIPFVGGLAVADDKINTRWQDVVISIMGPCFGLLMSLACLMIYAVTDSELFAGAAVLSALLNLFNLLPILPLDGGHVLKSISFSMRSWIGLSVCMSGIALGGWVAYTFGLALLVFFLFIGAMEVIFEWRQRHLSHLIPLDTYGQVFSSVWYILVAAGHIWVVVSFADSDNPILSLPMKILAS